MKKIIFSGILLVSLLIFVIPVSAKVDRVSDGYGSWNVTGDWILTFVYGGNWDHDIHITTQNSDGTFNGTGGYPAGGPYLITETITGIMSGNNITIHSVYDGSTYSYDAVGTIETDGSMSGTLTTNAGQIGPWSAPIGSATREVITYKNHGQYVKSQENKEEAAQSRIGMPIQSMGHIK